MYYIPGLEFVNENLSHYENLLKQKIIRVPHPLTFELLKRRSFQNPNRLDLEIPVYTKNKAYQLARERAKSLDAQIVTGHQKYMNFSRDKEPDELHPLWNWNSEQIAKRIKGYKLGIEHTLFGCSFNAFTYKFLKPISECYPRDMARILQFFPQAEIEIYRKEVLTDAPGGW